MQKLNRDIGSSFYTLHENDSEYKALKEHQVSLSENYSLYYSGRNALLAILKHIESLQEIQTIWLPNYYCDTVVNMVQKNYASIQFYDVNPFDEFDKTVDFNVFSKPEDVVILNNFWGLSSFEYDIDRDASPIIIEDHTHGWLSKESLNSKADYCISAIRKYYPIPTGGMAWMPRTKEPFNFYKETIDKHIQQSWSSFNQSMNLKRQFIKKGNTSLKQQYLSFLKEADVLLSKSNTYTEPKADHKKLLNAYISLNPNSIKESHLQYIYKNAQESKQFKVIKRRDFLAFGLLVLFKNKDLFNDFKSHMIANAIYPAHLWPNNTINLEWQYILNIHVDFRYTLKDMDYIIETVNNWINTNG